MISKKIFLNLLLILTFVPFPVLSMDTVNSMKMECLEEVNTQIVPLVPKHFSDTLLYSTVRIEVNKSNNKTEVGTGFIYLFSTGQDNQEIPFLVTNKHVVKDAMELKFRLHESDLEGNPLNKVLNVSIRDIQSEDVLWNKEIDVDLCALYLEPVFNFLNEKLRPDNKKIYYNSLSKLNTMDDTSTLLAIEDILMVGYPIGLSDSVNNFPIFRKGITASHPHVDYNGKPEFLIDAACFPGSSGSPVFLYNPFGYGDNLRKIQMGVGRLSLLGILYGGPEQTREGNIVKKDIPGRPQPIPDHSSNINIPINLGYVIKANQLENFEIMIKNNPHFIK